jgi:2-polyprenyl-6-methoxyphenol hydroxylase-like FAD-dependent oxidoreductase
VVSQRTYDIVVAGGGIAGSCFAGVMARAGYGVLLVEREAQFRDRVRGEATWPWGTAEVRRCGLTEVLERAGSIDIVGVARYHDRQRLSAYYWVEDAIDQLPEVGFVHPVLQECAFTWAAEQGATTLRPAKAVDFHPGTRPSISIQNGDASFEITTRLVVGADGKQSGVRRWTGGETASDPEHHRMGGVLVTGVPWDEYTDAFESTPQGAVNWFPVSREHTRIYLVMKADRLQESGVARSFDRLLEVAARSTPEGKLDGAVQAGPIAFFPNLDTWATRISDQSVTLIGDAAGSVDPTQGHGTAQLFRDVRELSEALIGERNWQCAIEGYAERRARYYDVLHHYDLWDTLLNKSEGSEADCRREQHERAKEADPTLGGWNQIEARGPDGLVADEAARRRYFGEDL